MGFPLAPLNNPDNIEYYARAGARELYMGFYDEEWERAFGEFAELNRMSGFGRSANTCSFQELLWAVPRAHAAGCSFYVTFNSSAYSAEMEPWLSSYFAQLAWAGADGVILSGPEAIGLAHEHGLKAVASTMCGIYNENTASLYERWGADRLILPRDLALSELRAITAACPDLEYEVFLMRNGCVFSDSHCLGMHGRGRGALCGEMREAERCAVCAEQHRAQLEQTGELRREVYHQYACGLCALWDLEQMGELAYKVVGRGDTPDAIAEDLELVAANIEVAQRCSSREEYLERMLRHPYQREVCPKGLNCYYPELYDGRC